MLVDIFLNVVILLIGLNKIVLGRILIGFDILKVLIFSLGVLLYNSYELTNENSKFVEDFLRKFLTKYS